MARGLSVVLVLLSVSCGGRTGLGTAGSEAPPPVRHLAVTVQGSCRYGLLWTYLNRLAAPRALAYEMADPCPPGDAEHRWELATDRYVVTFPSEHETLEAVVVLDAETLGEVRRWDGYLMGTAACAVGSDELWLPRARTIEILDLDTLESDSVYFPGLGLTEYGLGPCTSDGEVAFVCALLESEVGAVFQVRVADRSIEDVDPLASGVQGYLLPNDAACSLTFDPNHSRLFVVVADNQPEVPGWSWSVMAIDIGLSAEPRVLLSGERSRAGRLYPVVLPDGELFVLLERRSGHSFEWIRIDPESGAIVSLREVDFGNDGHVLSKWRAEPAVGDWIATLVPRSEQLIAESDVEYFNAITGEIGPRETFEEDPDALLHLPSTP